MRIDPLPAADEAIDLDNKGMGTSRSRTMNGRGGGPNPARVVRPFYFFGIFYYGTAIIDFIRAKHRLTTCNMSKKKQNVLGPSVTESIARADLGQAQHD